MAGPCEVNAHETSTSGGRRGRKRNRGRSRKIINRNVKLTAYDLTRKLCCVLLVFHIYYENKAVAYSVNIIEGFVSSKHSSILV